MPEKNKQIQFKLLLSACTHLEVFSGEQLHSHDGENQPEYKAHQQHVEDTGYGLHQGVDNNLQGRKPLERHEITSDGRAT